MTDPTPTPQEVIAVAQSGNTGAVKTVTDIRIEQLEAKLTARFDALEKENAELRKANAELYAYANSLAQQQNSPQPAPAPAPTPSPAQSPVAAAAVPDPNAEAAKAEQERSEQAMLDIALAKLGYKRDTDNSGM